MKRILVATFAALSLLSTASAASADHDYYPSDRGDECDGGGYCAEEDNRGDCRNTEKGANCEDNDFSPSFDKSPVEDSFKIGPICMPGSTCHFDDRPSEREQPQPQ